MLKMDLKRKKILAKEVLILTSVIAFVFVVYSVLVILENNREARLQDLNQEKARINLKIDSVKFAISNQIPNSYPDSNHNNVSLPPFPKDLKIILEIGKVKILYDATVKDFNLGTFNEFLKKMHNDSTRLAFYKIASAKFELGDYNTFSNKVKLDIKRIILTNKKLENLYNEIEMNEKAIKSIPFFDKDEILSKLILIMLVIVYPFRGLILLVKWSIKTVKE